jgi:hypothetical protein
MEEIARQDNALKVIEQLAEAWAGSTVYDVQKAFQNIVAVAKSAQQKMHPTLGESAEFDSLSTPAPKRVI